MTALRAIQIDTAPPIDAISCIAASDGYVTKAGGATITGTDWARPEAYISNSTFCSIHQPVSQSNSHVFLNGLWPHLSSPPNQILGSACLYGVQNAGVQHAVFLAAEEVSRALQTRLISAFSYKVVCDASTQLLDAQQLVPTPLPLPGYEQYAVANWDKFDAEPITAETLAYARRLMRLMPTSLGAPDIAPAADGSIALEWVPDDPAHKLDRLFLDIGPGEVWRAYWTLRTGEFGRIPQEGFSEDTKKILADLFRDLSA